MHSLPRQSTHLPDPARLGRIDLKSVILNPLGAHFLLNCRPRYSPPPKIPTHLSAASQIITNSHRSLTRLAPVEIVAAFALVAWEKELLLECVCFKIDTTRCIV